MNNQKCKYCNNPVGQYSYYLIRVAVKPPGRTRRYVTDGACCEQCHGKGEQVLFDRWAQPGVHL